jgi:hypothetical protein
MAEELEKATRKSTAVSAAISSAQVTDKTREPPGSLLQNGVPRVLGLVSGFSPPGWVMWLPSGQASLVLLAWYYGSGANLNRAA